MSFNNLTSQNKISILISAFISIFILIILAAILAITHFTWIAHVTSEIEEEIQDFASQGEERILKEIGVGHDVFWSKDGKIIYATGIFKNIDSYDQRVIEFTNSKHKTKQIFVMFRQFENNIFGYGELVTDYLFFERFLALIILVSIIFVFLISIFTSRKISIAILSPLKKIIKKSENISFENLNERIDESGNTNDIMVNLAGTLNNLFDKLQLSAQKITQFNQDVSHELRTPLAVIKSDLELVQKTKDFSKIDQTVEEIEHLSNIVEKLLFLAENPEKIQKGIYNQPEIEHILFKTIEQQEKTIADKKLNINKVIAECEINANIDLLENLLTNLLINITKYATPGSDVTIQIDSHEMIFQNETMHSFAPNEIDQIFTPFFRVDKFDQNSRGIGLSIVKKICDLHGWDVFAENNNGKFKITILFESQATKES